MPRGQGRKPKTPKKDVKMKIEVVAVAQSSAVVPMSRQLEIPRTAKIPRPPNAFMLFANEYRKKLAIQFPRESNKEISVRLGGMWKSMLKSQKEEYFKMAKEVDRQHKEKYPSNTDFTKPLYERKDELY